MHVSEPIWLKQVDSSPFARLPAMALYLVIELFKLFATGVLKATEVQRLAQAAKLDGWGHGDETAMRMARAGAAGAYTGNVQRDLFRAAHAAKLPESHPNPYMLEAPGPDGTTRTHRVYLPHEVFVMLRDAGQLADYTLGDTALLESGNEGLPKLVQDWAAHPDVRVATPAAVAPIGLHCDGASYSSDLRPGQSKSVYAASWNFLVVHSGRSRRFLFCVVPKRWLCNCGCQGWHTFQELFRVFAWSMSILTGRLTPATRHDASPWTDFDRANLIPAGLTSCLGALVQMRGDW